MKNNLKLLLIGLFLLVVPQINFAQWQFPLGQYGRLLPLPVANQSVGVGRFPTVLDMQAKLHVNSFYLSTSVNFTDGNVFRTDATDFFENNWQMWTGPLVNSTTEKFRVFNPALSPNITLQASAGNMHFRTVGTNVPGAFERMNIRTRTINGTDRTSLSINEFSAIPVTFPRSILHLGMNYFTGGIGGWRTWMDIGTFCDISTDFAWFGIMEHVGDTLLGGPLHNDAAVVWGDNISPAAEGADNFRIIFNAPMTAINGVPGAYTGLEVSRYAPVGRVGIGNFSANGSGIQPLRRLEIYDEGGLNLGGNPNVTLASAPQLRLTFAPNANVLLGIWTDFQTTSGGNLFLNPSNGGVNGNVGINTATPGNTLEINTNNPFVPGATGFSGLRFSDLTSASLAGTGNGTVLSLNANGDVVLVGDIGGGNVTACLGGTPVLTNFITKFTSATDICMSDIFETPTAPFNVGMGTTAPSAKLDVRTTATGTGTWRGGKVFTSGAHVAYVEGLTVESVGSGMGFGIIGIKNLTTIEDADGYGIYSYVTANNSVAASLNYGMYSYIEKTTGGTGGDVYGNWTKAYVNVSTNNVYGIFTEGSGNVSSGTTNVFGIKATATANGSNSPVYGGHFSYSKGSGNATAIEYAGYFSGDVYTTGNYLPSDAFLKNNIASISNPMSIINQLAPKQYTYKTSQFPQLNLPTGNRFGLIADDVQNIWPAIVKQADSPAELDTLGNIIKAAVSFKAINYTEIVPVLVGAVKQLDAKVDSLMNALAQCCPAPRIQGNLNNNTDKYTVELNDVASITLNQNDPNPFAVSTLISWDIPVEKVTKAIDAKLFFYDKAGNVLRTLKIEKAGYGELTVYSSNLISGTYTYTLIVNGQVIDTKRMVKTN